MATIGGRFRQGVHWVRINTKLHGLSLLKWPATRVDGGLVHLQVRSLFASDCSQSAIMIKVRQSFSHAAMPFPNSKEVKFAGTEYSSRFHVNGLLRFLVCFGLSASSNSRIISQ